jgi:Vanadium chloroperoxidase N-terminal domain/PAP2 superfamily
MKNSIEFWHDVCMEVVRRDFSKKPDGSIAPDQGGPTRTSRALAIAHLAMHDAHFGTTNPAATYLQRLPVPVPLPPPPAPMSTDSAIGTAAAICLLSTYPSHAAYINRMSAVFIDTHPDATARDNGHRYGEAIATLLTTLRKGDGAGDPMAYRPSTAYGRHREDPYASGQGFLSPQWGNVKHFCLAARVPLDPPPGYSLPDYLSDADYRADLKEVKEEGALISTKRSAEEKVIGYYWGYDGANEIGVPPRLYNQIARAWLDRHHPGDVGKAVQLLAMVNAGMADAGIDAWYHKYAYNLWRPVIGIREASHSTGPIAAAGPSSVATAGPNMGDPGWAPLGLPTTNEPERRALSRTPPFPAYPSGHATFGATLFQIMQRFSGAASMTLQDVLDADTANPLVAGQAFDFISDELDGHSVDADGSLRTRHLRQFRNFARPVWENAISRVYIGVHWRFDGMPRADVAGKRYGGVPLGLTVGDQTYDFFTA